MVDRTEAERNAAVLDDRQRRGVLAARPFALGGLAVRTIDGMCLTPLGLAVRAILQEQANAQ